jgi:hypothetical protein
MSEDFRGHYRKGAKTSIVRTLGGKVAPNHKFASLDELLAWLPLDQDMKTAHPELAPKNLNDHEAAKKIQNPRVQEERRNVQVTCWVFNAKKEGDDDFHVIIGNSPDPTKAKFLNVEVSGTVRGGPDAKILVQIRKDLKAFMGVTIPSGDYTRLAPKKAKVTGSLFFDADHSPGTIGPLKPEPHRPQTVWEIHPVFAIENA